MTIPLPLNPLITRLRIVLSPAARIRPSMRLPARVRIKLPFISIRVAPPVLPSISTGTLIGGNSAISLILGIPEPTSKVIFAILGDGSGTQLLTVLFVLTALMASRNVHRGGQAPLGRHKKAPLSRVVLTLTNCASAEAAATTIRKIAATTGKILLYFGIDILLRHCLGPMRSSPACGKSVRGMGPPPHYFATFCTSPPPLIKAWPWFPGSCCSVGDRASYSRRTR